MFLLNKVKIKARILLLVFLLLFIFPAIVVFYIVGPLPTLISFISSKQISGKVYDCITNMPIENVEVSISGMEWGFINGQLVWDKFYSKTTNSNSEGNYFINYNIGSSLVAKKEGYLQAYDYGSNGQKNRYGLIK